MAEMERCEVTIAGKDYVLIGPIGQAEAVSMAERINAEVNEILSAKPNWSAEKCLALVAMNIEGRRFELEKERDALKAAATPPSEEVKKLKSDQEVYESMLSEMEENVREKSEEVILINEKLMATNKYNADLKKSLSEQDIIISEKEVTIRDLKEKIYRAEIELAELRKKPRTE